MDDLRIVELNLHGKTYTFKEMSGDFTGHFRCAALPGVTLDEQGGDWLVFSELLEDTSWQATPEEAFDNYRNAVEALITKLKVTIGE